MTLNLDHALSHWAALGSDLHRLLQGVETEKDYDAAAALLEELDRLTERQPEGSHTVLAALLAEKLTAYDAAHHPPADVTPAEVLAFLMEQHGLKQTDLADLADQGTISRILSGKRGVGKKLAAALAGRFGVDRSVFL